jgi:hypothetical protein
VVILAALLSVMNLAAQTPADGLAEGIYGSRLSTAIFNELAGRNFSPERQDLDGQGDLFGVESRPYAGTAAGGQQIPKTAASGEFPFNVVVTLPQNAPAPTRTLALIFSQEEWSSLFPVALNFLETLRRNELPVRVQAVFTAGDTSLLPAALQRSVPAGTLGYIQRFDGSGENAAETGIGTNLCALVLLLGEVGSRPRILPGTRPSMGENMGKFTFETGISAPLWLVRQLPVPIAGGSLAFYRFNLGGHLPRLEAFSNAGIPAAALGVNAGRPREAEALFNTLTDTIGTFRFPDQGENDVNYSAIPGTPAPLYFTEGFFLAAYLIVAACAILALCLYSTRGRWKLWPILPGILTVNALCLAAGQGIFDGLFPAGGGIFLPLMFRVLFAWVMVSSGCVVFYAKWKTPPQLYGCLNTLQSVLNILIFGAFDLLFLFFFVVQFLITSLFGRQKKAAPLYILGFLSFALYIPVAYELLHYADRAQLFRLTTGGLPVHFFLTGLMMPFILMWLHLLTAFIASRKHTKGAGRGLTKNPAASSGALYLPALGIIFFAAAWLLSSIFSFKNVEWGTGPSLTVYADGLEQDVSLSARTQSFFGELEVLNITASSNLPLIRCDIQILSAAPIISSPEVSVTETRSGALDFRLAEYPPNPLGLSCMVTAGFPVSVQATFYLYDKAENRIIRRQRETVLPRSGGPV